MGVRSGLSILLALLALSGCQRSAPDGVPPPDPREVNSGGEAATVRRFDAKAYSQSAPGLDFAGEANFKAGNMIFRGTPPGLGPLFNTQSCQGCHKFDGRGDPPASAELPMDSMFLRLSVPGADPRAGVVPDPVYGDQLQTFGIGSDPNRPYQPPLEGLPRAGAGAEDAVGEGYAFIEYEELPGQYPDGQAYSLRRPVYKVRDLSYGPFADGIMFSPRVAPTMQGLGLLEAVPEEAILALADPDDANGDGISGRPNLAWDAIRGEPGLGRFGYKAGTPSILQQSAGAFRGDIGATSSLAPEELCTAGQPSCRARAGEAPELSDTALALVEFYARHLAVPARRGWDAEAGDWQPAIRRGRALFHQAGCAGCHTPRFTTGEAAGSALGELRLSRLDGEAKPLAALSGQAIWPYTDLLLHDMGGSCQPVRREAASGEPCQGADCLWVQRCEGLADGRPEFQASGSEWRTAPLWGLGLTRVVNPKAGFLHDGRARSIEEAILWHGGEAEASREAFRQLGRDDRAALLSFLESL